MDGVTVRGAAHVSNQHITGEALPILAQQGTELLAGALATDSWLVLRATKVARESALARIAELTEFAKVGAAVLCMQELLEWLRRALQAPLHACHIKCIERMAWQCNAHDIHTAHRSYANGTVLS